MMQGSFIVARHNEAQDDGLWNLVPGLGLLLLLWMTSLLLAIGRVHCMAYTPKRVRRYKSDIMKTPILCHLQQLSTAGYSLVSEMERSTV